MRAPQGWWSEMFERFTDRARRVVVLAQEEAGLLSHSYIGTEHLLLGLIREEHGIAAKALASLGIELEAVRERVGEIVGPGTEPLAEHKPFTPRAKRVLELSLREALQLGHNDIGTEHILLGLTREGEGVAARVLVALGADLNRIREQVISLPREYSGERSAGPGSPARAEVSQGWGVPGRRERALVSGFRVRLRAIESRVIAMEQLVGFGPDVSELDVAITQTLGEKHAAADAEDYEQAAGLRDTERRLRAEKVTRQQQWSASHPGLPALVETVRQLGEEVRSLRELLREHGIESAAEPRAAGQAGEQQPDPAPADGNPPDGERAAEQRGGEQQGDHKEGGAA